jgi:hypothetical protein
MNEQKVENVVKPEIGKASPASDLIVNEAGTATRGTSEKTGGEWNQKPGRIREQLKDLVNYRDSQCI